MSDAYAEIGNPMGRSKSSLIHGLFAAAMGEDLEYTAIARPLDGFAATVRDFIRRGGRGLNVTAPFKVQAFELADRRSERAELAGAVDASRFEGALVHADHFDGVGLVNDIERNPGVAVRPA